MTATKPSVVKHAAALICTLVLAAAVVLPIAYWRSALPGLGAAAAAWAVCLVSGLLALWLVQRFNDPSQGLHQVLGSTLVRMSMPLAACLVVHISGGTLAEAGFVYYILAFYFVMLAVEVVLLTKTLPRRPSKSQTG